MNAITLPQPEPLVRWRDNPILTAQRRRRLRPKQAVPILVIVAILGTCGLLMAGVSGQPEAWHGVRVGILALMAVALYAGGTPQVSGMVDEDQAEGLLDFHRASPTSAWTDCLGYAFGCAAREYAVALVLLPFLTIAHFLADGTVISLLLALVVMATAAALYHFFGVLAGLSSNSGGWLPLTSRHRARQKSLVAVVSFFWIAIALASTGEVWLLFAHLTPIVSLAHLGFFGPDLQASSVVTFFGAPVNPVLFTVVTHLFFAAFLGWAGARKLRNEEAHAFTRTGALVFFGILTLLFVGPAWTRFGVGGNETGLAVAAYAFGGLIAVSALAASLVPTHLEELRARRRARHAAGGVPLFATGAPGHHLVVPFLALFLAGVLLTASGGPAGTRGALSSLGSTPGMLLVAGAASFVAVLVALLERNRLVSRKAWRNTTLLGVFLLFVLPWIAAGILSAAGAEWQTTGFVAALSPVFGTGASFVIFSSSLTPAADLGDLQLDQVVVSLAVSAIVAGILFLRCARARSEMTD